MLSPKLPNWLTSLLPSLPSWAIAIYFFWAFHLHVGFPPTEPLTHSAAAYLALFVLFLVLPAARKLRIGKLFDFEAKVDQVRTEVKEVRTETRDLVSTMASVANSISTSVNQSLNLYLPPPDDTRDAKQGVADLPTPSLEAGQDQVLDYVGAGDSDPQYALARMRIDLERALRRVLETHEPADSRFAPAAHSASSLFLRLADTRPRYRRMKPSFEYVINACNAAIHGRHVPDNVAYETIDMGLRLLRDLEGENAVE